MRGDHIKVFRYFYFHHAIDMGDGTCIHFTGEPFKKFDSYIRRTDMDVFLKGGTMRIVEYDECKDPDEVVNTALSYGMAGYHRFGTIVTILPLLQDRYSHAFEVSPT